MKKGFSSNIYIEAQAAEIQKRVKKFKRLYLEFGGKLIYDSHAARVLPGYKKTTKVEILKRLKDVRVIYCVNARDLESNRVVGRSKRTYQQQVLRDLKDIRKYNLPNDIVVITRFSGEPKAQEFSKVLIRNQKKVYFQNEIKGYSKSPENAINGYKSQEYIPIKENLIAITGPASGSGKMAVALTQIYLERKNNINSGYAKFETFPIWNLPLNHPINLAYEAATADLQDKNMIDPFHKEAYKIISTNYNRDINNFSILQELMKRITKQKFPFGYKSPTDMGVNMAIRGIIDSEVCREASIKEIYRRAKFYRKEFKKGRESTKTIERMETILKKLSF